MANRDFRKILSCAIIALALLSCSRTDAAPKGKSVLILGFDAATWHVMGGMVKSGEMPNVAKLMQEGSYASLKTYHPAESPLIWTSIATGKTPEKHGINFFVTRLPHEYESIPIDSGARKTKALWNILSEKGIGSTFISWWASWPAEKVVGNMLTDRYGDMSLKGATYPEGLAAEIKKNVPVRRKAEIEKLIGVPKTPYLEGAGKEKYEAFLELAKWDLMRQDAAEYLIKKGGTPVHAVYFRHLDPAQHEYWKYMEPEGFSVSEEEKKAFGGLIPAYYRMVDGIIGRLVSMMPKDSLVIVLSDHGMASFTPDKMGYMMDQEYIARQDGHLALRVPKPNELLGRLGYLKPGPKEGEVDWGGTRVFADDTEHLSWTRTLIVNREGEFPKGIVPKDSSRALLRQLERELLSIRTEGGERFVISAKAAPDGGTLTARFNPAMSEGARLLIKGKAYPASEFIKIFSNSGEHGSKQDGVLLVKGPGVKKGHIIADASVLDVAPTLLFWLGLPAASDMDGKALMDAFEPSFVKNNNPGRIASYDGKGFKGTRQGGRAGSDKEIKEKLRSLGYIQ